MNISIQEYSLFQPVTLWHHLSFSPFQLSIMLIFINTDFSVIMTIFGLPSSSVVKNLSANTGDKGPIAGLGRFPGEGNGNPLQYSCLGNPMNRGT